MSKNPFPTRMCSGCMTRRSKDELIRVVRLREGEVLIDTTGKADGRGVYVCPEENCIKKAEKKNCFARNLRCQVPQDIYEKLRMLAKGDEQYSG